MIPKTVSAMLTAAFLLWAPFTLAQEYATVRDLEGKAFVQAYDESEPQALTMNTPLTDGDVLWTNAGGRVGLMLKDGNRIWLDESSRLEAEQFPGADTTEDKTLRVRIWKGAVLLEVASWNGRADDFFIATPSTMVTAREEGLFLLQIETVDRTRVTSLRGNCKVTSGGSTVDVGMGQTTYAEYGYAPLAPTAADLALSLPLVEYRNLCSRSRKGTSTGGQSRQYLSPDLYAYAPDLDQNGTWTSVEGYGDSWVPNGQAADWTPYSNGQWSYTSWGMTWVPYEPWGWVPFHYGSWCFAAGLGWAWNPGYLFAPAWCSWYWGADYIGWCPLDMWGYPLWGSAGWNSCGFNNLYSGNSPVVRHRGAPPPNPIYPRPHGTPGRATTRPGEPRVVSPSRGPALTPRDVRDFNRGKVTSDVLRTRALQSAGKPDSGTSARRFTPDPESPSTGSRQTARQGIGIERPGRTARTDNPRALTPSDTRGSTRGANRNPALSDQTRPSSDRGTNPRRSWSPAPTNPSGDSTRRSPNTGTSRPPAGDRGTYSQRTNPRGAPPYTAPRDSAGSDINRSSRGRTYGDGGYDSAPPSSGQGRYDRSSPRSDGYSNRAIPSRPSPPVSPQGGYSPGRGGGNAPGRSQAPQASPPPTRSSPPPSSPPPSSGSGHGSGSGSGGGRRNR
jgi:hypothetical protein